MCPKQEPVILVTHNNWQQISILFFQLREMDGVVHNPDILQVSNEPDLSTIVNTINSVEHNVYMEKRAENQEAGIQVLFFLPIYI